MRDNRGDGGLMVAKSFEEGEYEDVYTAFLSRKTRATFCLVVGVCARTSKADDIGGSPSSWSLSLRFLVAIRFSDSARNSRRRLMLVSFRPTDDDEVARDEE